MLSGLQRPFTLAIALFTGVSGAIAIPVLAQPVAAPDGTGTLVNQSGQNQFNIVGGTTAGTNLFHSFQQFNLGPSQTANFIANPNISNILGRVVGGSPSRIDGLIQVSGTGANLYLINPSGLIFGPNASLNVPASFRATTADHVGFGSVGSLNSLDQMRWFHATGPNNYAELTGTPRGFAFTGSAPAAVSNAANLSVAPGSNLILVGGSIDNQGPGAIVTFQAPGNSLVTPVIAPTAAPSLTQLTIPGFILNFEVKPIELCQVVTCTNGNIPSTIPVTALPPLLAGRQPPSPGPISPPELQPLASPTQVAATDQSRQLPSPGPISPPELQPLASPTRVAATGRIRAIRDDISRVPAPNNLTALGRASLPPARMELGPGAWGSARLVVENSAIAPARQLQSLRNPEQRPARPSPNPERIPAQAPPRNRIPPPANAARIDNLPDSLTVLATESRINNQFRNFLGLGTPVREPSVIDIQEVLLNNQAQTNLRSGIVYLSFSDSGQASSADSLEIVLISSQGAPTRKLVPGATRQRVIEAGLVLRREVTNFRSTRASYLSASKQLYQWLIAPIEEELQAEQITNLVLIADDGLRSLPLAALHDGEGFIIERYSIGLMPSFSLTDLRYSDLRQAQVLAMGASQFRDKAPLPAVPLELRTITTQLWRGSSFLNESFTLDNLRQQRQQQPFQIVHLATHAVFASGDRSNSYIQLWDGRLSLDQLAQLRWRDPPVDLLVLSACETAIGDQQAELGFAGLAVQAGVKSAMASLWSVSDEGTLGLMMAFYRNLKDVPIKSEALRQAQLAMLRGEVRIKNGQLLVNDTALSLSQDLAQLGNVSFIHPYFWSAFTIIGSPW